jgi:geranylgeranyl pyrophosphate synthase
VNRQEPIGKRGKITQRVKTAAQRPTIPQELATELVVHIKALASARKRIDAAIASTFSGHAHALQHFGLTPSDKELAHLYSEAMQTSGKRVRGWLLVEWYRASGGEDTAAALKAAVLIETIHTATLVIDDVQDKSALRRGKPTLHTQYGSAVAVSVGLSLLFGAANAARKLPNGEDVQALILEYVTQLAHGQTKDVLWHHNGALTISEPAYERMCSEKTAKLFILATSIAQAMAGIPVHERAMQTLRKRAPAITSHLNQYFPDTRKHIANALDLAGVIFQLADDAANITTEIGKEACEDIRERKITALALHLAHHGKTDERRALHAFFRKRSVSPSDVSAIATLYETSGALASVERRIEELVTGAEREIAVLEHPAQQQLLRALLALSRKR